MLAAQFFVGANFALAQTVSEFPQGEVKQFQRSRNGNNAEMVGVHIGDHYWLILSNIAGADPARNLPETLYFSPSNKDKLTKTSSDQRFGIYKSNVKGNAPVAATFAFQALSAGAEVLVQSIDGAAPAKIEDGGNGAAFTLTEPARLATALAKGGVVYDKCRGLAGMVLIDSSGSIAIAPTGRILEKAKEIQGLQPRVASTPCATAPPPAAPPPPVTETKPTGPSPEELQAQAAKAAEEAAAKQAKDLQDKLRLAERGRNKNATEAARLRAQLAEQEALLAAAQEETRRAEEAKAEADRLAAEELARVEAERKQVEEREREQEEELERVRAQKEREAERAQNFRRSLWIAGAIAAVLAIGGGVTAFFLVRQRSKTKAAQSQVRAAQKKVAQVEEKLANPIRYHDVLLVSAAGNLKLLGDKLPQENGGVILGRNPEDADVIINDEAISRRHARFYVKDGVIYIEDLNSRNGTSVRGQKLSPHAAIGVGPSDVVKFGHLEFSVRVVV